MKQDEIIKMAQKANAPAEACLMLAFLGRFAKLVEERTVAKEREAYFEVAMKAAEDAVDTAMALEREACALESENCGAIHVAKRIRARAQAERGEA